jgi:predicted ATP-binding protein involved in virulence
LSDGEKCYLTLVADIARRLATANPELEDPLTGDGIVMIDEVDLHLHPSWQAGIIPKLRDTFGNCQFFLTTHSPHVVSDIKSFEKEMLLLLDKGERVYSGITPFGKPADSILTDFFQLDSLRNKETQAQLDHIWGMLGTGACHTEEFGRTLKWLEEHLGTSDFEIARIKAEKSKLIKLAAR